MIGVVLFVICVILRIDEVKILGSVYGSIVLWIVCYFVVLSVSEFLWKFFGMVLSDFFDVVMIIGSIMNVNVN